MTRSPVSLLDSHQTLAPGFEAFLATDLVVAVWLAPKPRNPVQEASHQDWPRRGLVALRMERNPTLIVAPVRFGGGKFCRGSSTMNGTLGEIEERLAGKWKYSSTSGWPCGKRATDQRHPKKVS